ncbi:ABC transporter substrate-binding protein [Amorphus orientalis]|uniref:ABC-type branched-subunit amino acid transport system substrate-binding protein n=1 Tax=Amorphus orientalis TaxID=649198 RepID=A0AAE4AU52_9HYPH|nr:ABC transporter substrate-binding protein [Amorphus orientalis]MDQ0316965.1 ABC-type branched-subunit amino acid transport system substrate-binding protein [Amorphus orientalis]
MAINRWMTAASVVAATAVALASPAFAQDLKIGALMPMTGDLSAYGEADLSGIQLAAEEINNGGGNVEVIVADTQTNPQAGVDAAQKLVNVEGVHAIVGALSSGVTIPVATSVTSREGVVQISGASTSPTITTLNDNGYLFRTVPSDAFQGIALAKLVNEKGVKNVSIIYVNNAYGQGLADAFEKAYTGEQGGTVSEKIPFEQGQASYRGEVQRADSGDAEALLLIAYPENGTVILRQALEGGHFDKFIFTDGMKAPEVIEQIGAQYMNGSYGTVPQSPESAGLKAFQEAYEQKYGEVPPLPYIDTAYDATMLIALAAVKAGSNDRTAIRDALVEVANPPGEKVGPGEYAKAVELLKAGTDINYEGAAGSQDFDENGDVPGTIGQWSFEDGKIVDGSIIEVN